MEKSIKNCICDFLNSRNKIADDEALESVRVIGDAAVLDSLDVLLVFTELEGILLKHNLRCDLLSIVYDEKFIGQSITVADLIDYITSNSKEA